MTWQGAFEELGVTIASRAQLLALGATSGLLTRSVRGRQLIRVRRDHYAVPGTDRHILRAVRVGGLITCDTALRDYGLFGFDAHATHVRLDRDASRLRSPRVTRQPLSPHNRDDVKLHWRPPVVAPAHDYRVTVTDALFDVLRCAPPRLAVASIDSALHQGLLTTADLAELFAGASDGLQSLRGRIDARSEAGQETVLRMAFQDAGVEPEIQVVIDGVGRVDLVLEGRLITEADSRLAHDGWELHVRDRDRDIDAARLGYMTLRPAYNRTMFRTGEVVEAALHLLSSTRRFRTYV